MWRSNSRPAVKKASAAALVLVLSGSLALAQTANQCNPGASSNGLPGVGDSNCWIQPNTGQFAVGVGLAAILGVIVGLAVKKKNTGAASPPPT